MNEKIKLTALLCAFMLVFSTTMSGCAKKVQFEEQTTTRDNKIKINTVDSDIPDGSSIVIGDDGQSYLVDGEGNSVVYEAPSTYVIPDAGAETTKSTATTTKSTTKSTTSKTIRTITTTTTVAPTTSQQDKVYGVLLSRRQNIDDRVGNYLDNYSVDTLDVRFENGGKEWAVKLIKGKYGSSTVGCETCIYIKEAGQSNWQEADDADKKNVAMTLWQYVDDEKVEKTEVPTKLCWWTSILKNSTLYGGEEKTLIMKSVITFSTDSMKEAFCDSLEENGIACGTTNNYQTPNRYSTDGRTVTIIWR